MTKDDSQTIICDFHGRKIELYNGEVWKKEAVKRIIPMRMHKEGAGWQGVQDVEILIDKQKNRYFSAKMFLEGTSWVKGIRVGGVNLSVKGRMKIITHTDKFTEEDWAETANYIEALKKGICGREEIDPTPWCTGCHSMTKAGCDCGPLAENN